MSKPSDIDKIIDKVIELLEADKTAPRAEIAGIDIAIGKWRALQTHSGPKAPTPTRKRRKLVGSETLLAI